MEGEEDWELDEVFFSTVDEAEFMEEIRKYKVLYDTKQKTYKNKNTTRYNAWKDIARKFKGTVKECETRLFAYIIVLNWSWKLKHSEHGKCYLAF